MLSFSYFWIFVPIFHLFFFHSFFLTVFSFSLSLFFSFCLYFFPFVFLSFFLSVSLYFFPFVFLSFLSCLSFLLSVYFFLSFLYFFLSFNFLSLRISFFFFLSLAEDTFHVDAGFRLLQRGFISHISPFISTCAWTLFTGFGFGPTLYCQTRYPTFKVLATAGGVPPKYKSAVHFSP